jgi:hypothetical protein
MHSVVSRAIMHSGVSRPHVSTPQGPSAGGPYTLPAPPEPATPSSGHASHPAPGLSPHASAQPHGPSPEGSDTAARPSGSGAAARASDSGAGGSSSATGGVSSTWCCNPQFRLTVKRAGEVLVCLGQQDPTVAHGAHVARRHRKRSIGLEVRGAVWGRVGPRGGGRVAGPRGGGGRDVRRCVGRYQVRLLTSSRARGDPSARLMCAGAQCAGTSPIVPHAHTPSRAGAQGAAGLAGAALGRAAWRAGGAAGAVHLERGEAAAASDALRWLYGCVYMVYVWWYQAPDVAIPRASLVARMCIVKQTQRRASSMGHPGASLPRANSASPAAPHPRSPHPGVRQLQGAARLRVRGGAARGARGRGGRVRAAHAEHLAAGGGAAAGAAVPAGGRHVDGLPGG